VDKLASLALESTVKDLKHRLLIDIIGVVNFLDEPFVGFLFPFCHLFSVGHLIDLFINLLHIEVILRRV
jgi:hypothetical protein